MSSKDGGEVMRYAEGFSMEHTEKTFKRLGARHGLSVKKSFTNLLDTFEGRECPNEWAKFFLATPVLAVPGEIAELAEK